MSEHNDCIFCKIARGEIPVRKIFEDEDLMAFYDTAPQAPLHFLVIPKRHITDLMSTMPYDMPLLGKLLFKAQWLAAELGYEEQGGRFVINCKSDGGQTVPHLHIHVLGGRELGWPPG